MFRVFENFFKLTDKIPVDELGKTYDCSLCESGGWLSETEVEIHRRAFHRNEIEELMLNKHVCLPCGQKFKSDDDLLAHIKTVHFYSSPTARRIEREIFICDYCHDFFMHKQLLIIHMMNKHRVKITLKSILCPICPWVMKPRLAYSHMSSRHHCQSVSVCPVCLTKRPNRRELASHMTSHAKHYHCAICGYMGTKEKDFNNHLDRYSTRKPHPMKKYRHCFLPPQGKPRYQARFSYVQVRPVMLGVVIPENVYICILCRDICTKDQMRLHVERDHSSPMVENRQSMHKCFCGEEFSTKIMLKHHAFKQHGPNQPDASQVEIITLDEDSSPTNEEELLKKLTEESGEQAQYYLIVTEEEEIEKSADEEDIVEIE